MGNGFLYGQSSGLKMTSGEWTASAYLYTATVQISKDFVPDYVLMIPVSGGYYSRCDGITVMLYSPKEEKWDIVYDRGSSSSSAYCSGQGTTFSDYFSVITYDKDTATFNFALGPNESSSGTYSIFYKDVTYRWYMWKE